MCSCRSRVALHFHKWIKSAVPHANWSATNSTDNTLSTTDFQFWSFEMYLGCAMRRQPQKLSLFCIFFDVQIQFLTDDDDGSGQRAAAGTWKIQKSCLHLKELDEMTRDLNHLRCATNFYLTTSFQQCVVCVRLCVCATIARCSLLTARHSVLMYTSFFFFFRFVQITIRSNNHKIKTD